MAINGSFHFHVNVPKGALCSLARTKLGPLTLACLACFVGLPRLLWPTKSRHILFISLLTLLAEEGTTSWCMEMYNIKEPNSETVCQRCEHSTFQLVFVRANSMKTCHRELVAQAATIVIVKPVMQHLACLTINLSFYRFSQALFLPADFTSLWPLMFKVPYLTGSLGPGVWARQCIHVHWSLGHIMH